MSIRPTSKRHRSRLRLFWPDLLQQRGLGEPQGPYTSRPPAWPSRTTELGQANQRLIAEMTERERTDARVQLLQSEFFHAMRLNAAGQMAAALAHELNQPLTATANSINAARRVMEQNDTQPSGKVSEIMSEPLSKPCVLVKSRSMWSTTMRRFADHSNDC